MRLLNVETYELKDFLQSATYAILSHRWYGDEITFQTLNTTQLRNTQERSPQLDKIRGTCARAKEDGLKWVWIDSCCINKESSQELNESINSMFQWYQEAAVCYTYLSDVLSPARGESPFRPQEAPGSVGRKHSEWFERGWTLQELLAPRKMRFYDRNWQLIGSRAQLATEISRITGIDAPFLTGEQDFHNASIATKLSWQADRRTTKVEDIAYSLVGVIGVMLVPSYGEGRLAFQRLQGEILRTLNDESIFAWTAPQGSLPKHSLPWPSDQWGLLAPSPDCFRNSRDITINGASQRRPPGHISTTPEGVRFPMPSKDLQTINPSWGLFYALVPPFLGPFMFLAYFKYKHSHRKVFPLTLNCWRKDQAGELRALRVFLCRDTKGDQEWRRCNCAELGLANKVPVSATSTDISVLQPTGIRWYSVL